MDLSTHIEKNGFKRNPHDWCCFNKMIKGKQATVLFHVDDLEISHVKEKVVMDIINDLSKRFGKLADLTIHRGTIHEYVGIKFDFLEAGKVKVDMRNLSTTLLQRPIQNLWQNFVIRCSLQQQTTCLISIPTHAV